MTVQIRSATYTSSYTSGTLTVARPSGMVAGDFLVVFLVAMGVYWGNAYWGSGWHHEYGNPPPPTPDAPPPTSPPVAPVDYPHHPPMSTLAQAAGGFDHVWLSGGTHYYGNYWSNLGLRQSGGGSTDWDNAASAAALAQWPFIDGWVAPRAPDDANQYADPCMFTITAVGRTVDGSEASTFTFTLNNPLDAEYDYRAVAMCFTANDWAGNFFDNNIDADGTGARSLSTADVGFFPATGVRETQRVSTYRSSGGTDLFNSLAGYGAWADIWGTWPIDPANYIFLADATTPELAEPDHPTDLVNPEELIVNLVTYAGPTSFGDPTSTMLADLSVTPHVDPLPVLHQEVWTKGSSTLMVHLTTARPTVGHASTADGDGIIVITPRLLSGAGGPIVAPYPPALTESPSTFTEYCLGIALSFRVRVPYVAPLVPAIPARLATIVG
jgi:hypothetical protein